MTTYYDFWYDADRLMDPAPHKVCHICIAAQSLLQVMQWITDNWQPPAMSLREVPEQPEGTALVILPPEDPERPAA